MSGATPEIDLHGLRPEAAQARLQQGLHGARIAGHGTVRVITGRGWGNREWKPVLRDRVEAWLRSADAKRYGVQSFQRASRGGALDVRLA